MKPVLHINTQHNKGSHDVRAGMAHPFNLHTLHHALTFVLCVISSKTGKV
jgi:hypothetical protein